MAATKKFNPKQAWHKTLQGVTRANLQIRDGICSGTIDGKRIEDRPVAEFLVAYGEMMAASGGMAGTGTGATLEGKGTGGSGRSAGSGGKGRGTKTRTSGTRRKQPAGTA